MIDIFPVTEYSRAWKYLVDGKTSVARVTAFQDKHHRVPEHEQTSHSTVYACSWIRDRMLSVGRSVGRCWGLGLGWDGMLVVSAYSVDG